MRTDDAESDLDRELTRLKLRDIIIGSAVAALLLFMMPNGTQRSAATTAGGRARIATPLLPKPKPNCAKHQNEHCPAQMYGRHHAMMRYPAYPDATHHTVDIRV